MSFFADLHIHSHFSRATSRQLDVPTILQWAQKKGLSLVGTGDFTHPGWLSELRESLQEDGNGFLVPKEATASDAASGVHESVCGDVHFILQVEVSSIFKKGDRVRKVHTLVYVPSFDAAERFGTALGRLGNVKSDGRPILGLDPLRIMRLAKDADSDAMVIPAHVWTPHFSLFGSQSGFDAIEECFEDMSDEIFALETGLSSDVLMNRRWSALDRFALTSSSDAHSPAKLGREATIFDCGMSYPAVVEALEQGHRRDHDGSSSGGLIGTVEFFPEEGKYHLAGHRKCDVCATPEEVSDMGGICPVCGKKMTPGVLGRVDALADRPQEAGLQGFAPQHCLIPLAEVLSELLGVGSGSKTVARAYEKSIARFGPELDLLGWMQLGSLKAEGEGMLAEALRRMRSGEVRLEGGFDGRYGHVGLFESGEVDALLGQGLMFDLGRSPRLKKSVLAMKGADSKRGSAQDELFTSPANRDTGGLTTEQSRAVDTDDGAILLVAGPGTGKTRTLVARAKRVIRDRCEPRRVLVLTFTNRAADEAGERLAEVTGDRHGPVVATFHSFALSALSSLYRSRDYEAPDVIGSEEVEHILVGMLESSSVPDATSEAARILKSRGRGDMFAGEDARRVEELVARMRERGVVDLDGIVPLLVRELLEDDELRERLPERYRHVLVDEFQDISRDQYDLLKLLKPDGKGLFAVGDPDQSIYSFRGSDPRAFERFMEDWPGVHLFRLTRSHRCPPEVLEAADAVLARDRTGALSVVGSAGQMESWLPSGVPVRMYRARTPLDEAAWVCREIRSLVGGLDMNDSKADGIHVGLGAIAVLARAHYVLEPVARVLTDSGIPIERASDRPLWDTPWVRVVMDAFKEAEPWQDLKETAKAALASEGLRPSARDVRSLIDLVGGLEPEEAAGRLATLREVDAFGLSPEKVSLLTMHAAKGLEFDSVFVVGCEDGVIPMTGLHEDGNVGFDDEKRLLFVAMTRAKRALNLSFPVAMGRGSGKVSGFLQTVGCRDIETIDGMATRKPRKPVQQGLFDDR